MYILDTDHMSALEWGSGAAGRRFLECVSGEIAQPRVYTRRRTALKQEVIRWKFKNWP